MFELTENHFRKLFSVKSTRLSATENRFSEKSFPFDQNLHLLNRKSFYILVLPSNDFRSCERNTLSQNTWNTRPNAAREREIVHSERERETDPERSGSFTTIFFWALFVIWGMSDIMYSFGNRENMSKEKKVFSMVFLRIQLKIRKYFPKHFLKCNQKYFIFWKISIFQKCFYTNQTRPKVHCKK